MRSKLFDIDINKSVYLFQKDSQIQVNTRRKLFEDLKKVNTKTVLKTLTILFCLTAQVKLFSPYKLFFGNTLQSSIFASCLHIALTYFFVSVHKQSAVRELISQSVSGCPEGCCPGSQGFQVGINI